jgi:hypothetical protein
MNCVYSYHMVQIVCSTEKYFVVFSEVTDHRKYNYPDRYELHTLAYELFIFHQ